MTSLLGHATLYTSTFPVYPLPNTVLNYYQHLYHRHHLVLVLALSTGISVWLMKFFVMCIYKT